MSLCDKHEFFNYHKLALAKNQNLRQKIIEDHLYLFQQFSRMHFYAVILRSMLVLRGNTFKSVDVG